MYIQNLKDNMKGALIFHLILVGILSILILSVKNRGVGGGEVCLTWQKLFVNMQVWNAIEI